mgnify:CR=1 FL=1
MISPFVALLRTDLKKRADELSEHLGRGGAAHWDDYKRGVGMIEGLRTAIDSIESQYRKFLNDDE